jgi:hypothetical protein
MEGSHHITGNPFKVKSPSGIFQKHVKTGQENPAPGSKDNHILKIHPLNRSPKVF